MMSDKNTEEPSTSSHASDNKEETTSNGAGEYLQQFSKFTDSRIVKKGNKSIFINLKLNISKLDTKLYKRVLRRVKRILLSTFRPGKSLGRPLAVRVRMARLLNSGDSFRYFYAATNTQLHHTDFIKTTLAGFYQDLLSDTSLDLAQPAAVHSIDSSFNFVQYTNIEFIITFI